MDWILDGDNLTNGVQTISLLGISGVSVSRGYDTNNIKINIPHGDENYTDIHVGGSTTIGGVNPTDLDHAVTLFTALVDSYVANTGGGSGLTPQQESDLNANTANRHQPETKGSIEALGISYNSLSDLPEIKKQRWTYPIGGEFLLDPNEINGWGSVGVVEDRNTVDLGDVGATVLSRAVGGFLADKNCKLVGFKAWFDVSSSASLAWGWVIGFNEKVHDTNPTTTTFLRDESFDRGVGHLNLIDRTNGRGYFVEFTEDDFVNNNIPENALVFLGVGAPTAPTSNSYVRIMSGHIILEEI